MSYDKWLHIHVVSPFLQNLWENLSHGKQLHIHIYHPFYDFFFFETTCPMVKGYTSLIILTYYFSDHLSHGKRLHICVFSSYLQILWENLSHGIRLHIHIFSPLLQFVKKQRKHGSVAVCHGTGFLTQLINYNTFEWDTSRSSNSLTGASISNGLHYPGKQTGSH